MRTRPVILLLIAPVLSTFFGFSSGLSTTFLSPDLSEEIVHKPPSCTVEVDSRPSPADTVDTGAPTTPRNSRTIKDDNTTPEKKEKPSRAVDEMGIAARDAHAPKKIFLLRHGEGYHQLGDKTVDPVLTETGQRQAAAWAEEMPKVAGKVDLVRGNAQGGCQGGSGTPGILL